MLMAHGLDKDFGSRRLFAGLSWQIASGARLGLVGPNGAGKTTLMRMMMDQEPIDAGQVSLGAGETRGYLPQEAPRVLGGTAYERVLGGAEELQALAQELADIERALEAADADVDAACALAERHADVQQRFDLRGGGRLEGRAEEALLGLGFRAAQMHAPLDSLSGGWWMRVELARLLLMQPDYLLLDEPTNHLDMTSLDWLEQFLRHYPGAWVVVSHDRYFLNRTVSGIAELTQDGVAVFPGDYDAYCDAQAELAAQQAAQLQGHKRKVAELEAFIARFGAKATKAKQAQSRAKTLARMAPPPPPARAKPRLHIALPEPKRSGAQVAQIQDAHKAFGARVLYRGLNLRLGRGDRVAIIGDNGAGKSTLLKILAGVLPLDAGTCELGTNVTPYYFAQHQLEMLDASRTVLEELAAGWSDASQTALRSLLGAFLFRGDSIEAQVGVLSGGEKARLALAKMLARPANLLLLDEPTNHLDLGSRDVLEAALTAYTGTMVCVSHDRYFITRVATRIWAVSGDGTLHDYPGDYEAYRWHVAQAREAEREAAGAAEPRGGRSGARAGRMKGAPADAAVAAPAAQAVAADDGAGASHAERKALQRQQRQQEKQVAAMEAQIEAAEARMQAIDALLCDVAVYSDAAQAQALLQERAELDETLPELMAKWEALAG